MFIVLFLNVFIDFVVQLRLCESMEIYSNNSLQHVLERTNHLKDYNQPYHLNKSIATLRYAKLASRSNMGKHLTSVHMYMEMP